MALPQTILKQRVTTKRVVENGISPKTSIKSSSLALTETKALTFSKKTFGIGKIKTEHAIEACSASDTRHASGLGTKWKGRFWSELLRPLSSHSNQTKLRIDGRLLNTVHLCFIKRPR